MNAATRTTLNRGTVIPGLPEALDALGTLDERRQRALLRYYVAAGAGGTAVGVGAARAGLVAPDPVIRRSLLSLAADEMDRADAAGRAEPLVRIAGVCGPIAQAVAEAAEARELAYHAALVNLDGSHDAQGDALVDHCRSVAEVLPLVVSWDAPNLPMQNGGSFTFWRRTLEVENLVAINLATGDRFRTIDVIRAIAGAGRDDVALYTGNHGGAVLDLVTPFQFDAGGIQVERRVVGGMLGPWSVWAKRGVELLKRCHAVSRNVAVPDELLRLSVEVADANAAIFDAADAFAGSAAGLGEVLRRQGLLAEIENSGGAIAQSHRDEIDRVGFAYPHLNDDAFVAEHLEAWLVGR